MKRLVNIRNRILIFLSVVFVSTGNELRRLLGTNGEANFLFMFGVIIASLILISVISPLLTKVIFGWRWIRKRILGNEDIEGYWLVRSGDKTKDNLFSVDSIIAVIFNSALLQYEASNFRIIDGGEELYTKSKAIYYDENSGLFINRFTVGTESSIQNGIAFGEALRKPGSDSFNRWEGFSINLGNNLIFRQKASKISNLEIKNYRSRYKNEWLNHYLMDHGNFNKRQNED